MYNPEMCSGVI